MKGYLTTLLGRQQSDAGAFVLFWSRLLFLLLSLSLFNSACIDPVPIEGKACNAEHACPDGYFCAGEICLSVYARCPKTSCQLVGAMDCAKHRICLDGCWQDCPACAQRCADPDYKDCKVSGRDEQWRCRQSEVCVLRVAGRNLRADCHARPPVCPNDDDSNCACLTSSAAVSMYPGPCDVEENCLDQSLGQIACETPMPPDAGLHNDAGSTNYDSGGQHHDASSMDAAVQVDSATSADASGTPVDASAGSDASAIFDGGIVDSGMIFDDASAADAGFMDATADDAIVHPDSAGLDVERPDASLSDSASPDSTVYDAASPDAERPDAAEPDAATACGPLAPDCFDGLGSGPFGDLCCVVDKVPARCVGQSWSCPSNAPNFANACDGFGQTCVDGQEPECADNEACLWTWEQAGEQYCASFGPASPCINASWDCVSGSLEPEHCACIGAACP